MKVYCGMTMERRLAKAERKTGVKFNGPRIPVWMKIQRTRRLKIRGSFIYAGPKRYKTYIGIDRNLQELNYWFNTIRSDLRPIYRALNK